PPGARSIMGGGFSYVYIHPDRPGLVCKVPAPTPAGKKAMAIEKEIYDRLGTNHPNIVKVVDVDEYGIWMERAAYGFLRLVNEGGSAKHEHDGGVAGMELTAGDRIRWCRDVARALEYIHSKNVRHADLSGRNLPVTADKRILLCDFSGSSLDGVKAMIWAEAGFHHPDPAEYKLPTIRSEIHTLGLTIYEILAGQQPHRRVEVGALVRLIEEGKYPDVSGLPLGDVIRRCWDGRFGSAAEVGDAIASHRAAAEASQTADI
ncbi:tyrosine-protein kinase transforming protein erbB, partial [Dichotomopilus funicola]